MQAPAWIKDNWSILAFLAVIAIAFILLSSKPSDIRSSEHLAQLVAASQPTVLTFYSNF
jgi:hypothetical protein